MKYFLLLLSMGLAFTACSNQETSTITTELEGSWLSSCVSSGSSSAKKGMVVVYSDATITAKSYSGTNCNTNTLDLTAGYSYTTYGFADNPQFAVKIDFVLSYVSMTVKDASLVSTFNTNAMCGYTDWALNVGKDIAGKTCDGSTINSVGQRIYSIYKLSSGTIPRLQMGTNSSGQDGTSNQARHTYLESVVLLKQ